MNEKEYNEIIEKWKEGHKEEVENGKCKHIFLECLPSSNVNKEIIKWEDSIGYKVHFIYKDIEDDIEIINSLRKNNRTKIKIKYKNICIEISSGNLKECRLGKILGKVTKEFKIEIGQIFKDEKRYLTIIDREYRKNKNGQNKKYYKYRCNKCGVELWSIESALLGKRKQGCSCCAGKTIVKGINDIATTNPEMIKYFVDIEDIYTHSYCSGEKVLCKCPICGFKKEIIISSLYSQGFSCPQCSDGISYPEKVMNNLLNKLNINFIYQYTKTNTKWCGKYKYDFYFELNNEKYIIETHGLQHYKNGSFNNYCSLERQQENDKNKKELALKNGIKEENYIVIDCRKSELEWIKNNIINSKLNEIFYLNNIDWIKIGQNSEKSLVKEVCNYWYLHNEINNEGLRTSDLSKIFKVNAGTVMNYLKKGTELGWCNYNAREELLKILKNKKYKHGVPIEIFKNNNSIGVFENSSELERQSEKLFGTRLNHSNILKVAKGEKEQYKGYTFKHISKEEYKRRINKINDNEETA